MAVKHTLLFYAGQRPQLALQIPYMSATNIVHITSGMKTLGLG